MKAINVTPAISSEASGPTQALLGLCNSLINEGVDVDLVALDWSPVDQSLPFFRSFPLGIGPRRLGRSPSMARWLRSEAKSGRISLIHNHGMWQMNSLYPGFAASQYHIPYIVSPHGTFSSWALNQGSILKTPFMSFLQKPSFRSVCCFHATSAAEYGDIRRIGFTQPVALIPLGIDIPTYTKDNKMGMRTLLFLGRVHPVKGLDMLLPAWGVLQSLFPDWQLRIVGSDEGYSESSGYLKQLQQTASFLGLERLEFTGPLYGEAKWRAFSEADLFVLPSYSENFGISVAESLASGTPVVVSKGAPWSDIETFRAGRWIDIGIDPLVQALESLMFHSSLSLRQMGLRGRDLMLNKYSWQRSGQQMKEVYHWATKLTSDPPPCIIFE